MDQNQFYKSMLESFFEGIYFVDKERKITFWNKGAEIISGFSSQDMIGRHCYDNLLNHVDEDGNRLCLGGCPLHATLQDGQSRSNEIYLHHKDGHRVKVAVRTLPIEEDGEIIGSVEVFNDLSNKGPEQKSQDDYTLEELKLIALYDQLTNLPNRRYLDNFLRSKHNEFKSLHMSYGIAYLDIDNFSKFNNEYGHDVGDKVLKSVAKTFNSIGRKTDVLGRWGGEEFLGVFSSVTLSQMETLCEKIRMLTEHTVLRDGAIEHHVTVSVGGTVVREGDSIEDVIKRADQLMYQSKKTGKNKVTVG